MKLTYVINPQFMIVAHKLSSSTGQANVFTSCICWSRVLRGRPGGHFQCASQEFQRELQLIAEPLVKQLLVDGKCGRIENDGCRHGNKTVQESYSQLLVMSMLTPLSR